MTSRSLLNILLAVILLGLLALAIYEPGKTERPAAEKITQLDPGAIQQLRIESPGRPPMAFKKTAGQWRMQSPFKVPANAGRIQSLLKVAQAKSVAEYPMSSVDANQLQLDTPVLSLTLDDVLLRFGSTAAMGGSRYVQLGSTLHLITDRYSHLARSAAVDFVSPLLLPQDSIVDELVLPNLRLSQSQGRWLLNAQVADADAIQSLLDEWRYARALRVSALEQSAATMQATQPITVIVGGKLKPQTVRFELLRNESEIILQRPALGIQYHFPLEAGERLLTLAAAIDETTP